MAVTDIVEEVVILDGVVEVEGVDEVDLAVTEAEAAAVRQAETPTEAVTEAGVAGKTSSY